EGHQGDIWSFVFLHDNVHIVSSSWDGTMCKWDCVTGLLVGESWKGDGGRILALELSPDGRTMACGREDGSVQRWNADGKMSKRVWTGHSKAVRSLSWSPGGSHLASGCEDGTILIRKAKSGEVVVGPIETEQNWVCSLAYSPSEDRIASGGKNNICIWNSNTGKLLVGPIKGLGSVVTSIVWSSDGSKLYSASDDFARVAQLWDTETYEPLGHPFRQDGDTYFVSFSPDGRYLACGGNDNKVTLWVVHD
ncbi:WD40 repeat-like protein, partial [Rhizopogon salebrosus TDB-379]